MVIQIMVSWFAILAGGVAICWLLEGYKGTSFFTSAMVVGIYWLITWCLDITHYGLQLTYHLSVS
ncbi:hypothetical protein [Leclercia sp.]|uniref:hypothetical protein n=1 Tax=Leclercia sp. TaxID=1898428 RepID=UPI002FDEE29F